MLIFAEWRRWQTGVSLAHFFERNGWEQAAYKFSCSNSFLTGYGFCRSWEVQSESTQKPRSFGLNQ
jgi:hypothetical protein